jgi:hypothetical protein
MIHLIHGIHTQGPSLPERLAPFFAPTEVKYPDYGWILGLQTKMINPIIVGTLLPYIGPDDVIVAHSNGCAIAYDLMLMGIKIKGAVFINAALEQDIKRQSGVGWIDVYFNQGDDITEAARVAERFGLVDKVWGEMGHAGYKGTDPLITNIDCGKTKDMPVVCGHSDLASVVNLPKWGPFVAKRIASHSTQGA